jgi:hypothetical protein
LLERRFRLSHAHVRSTIHVQARDPERALPSLHDLQFPTVLSLEFSRQLATFMSGIGDNGLNSREQWTQSGKQASASAAVRHASRFHTACDRQSQGITG